MQVDSKTAPRKGQNFVLGASLGEIKTDVCVTPGSLYMYRR
jgi:hypothetical protein